MDWRVVLSIAVVFLVFACGLLLAVLDQNDTISDQWAKGLYGFLIGSTTGVGTTVAAIWARH